MGTDVKKDSKMMGEQETKEAKPFFRVLFSPVLLSVIQLLAGILFMITLKMLDVFPVGIFIAVCAAAVFLLVLMFFLMKRKTGRVIPAKVVSGVLSFMMIFLSVYFIQTNAFLDDITDSGEQTYDMSVVVMRNSGYHDLKDLKGKTYGVAQNNDTGNIGLTIKEISRRQGALSIASSSSVLALADDLYSGKDDAVIISEAQRKLLTEKHREFGIKTKVIWKYRITSRMKDSAKRVDVTKDAFTVYLSGIDTRGSVKKAARSDVNMLVTVNPNTREILLTSIPRDYYVTLATSHQKDKLTHAGIYGIEESCKTVSSLMGMDMNYYIKVNFSSAEKLINAIGGVDIYSDRDFIPRANRKLHIRKGKQHMDGKTAVAFARERYSYSDGDNHRVKNQQDVMKAMIGKIESPKVVRNYPSILESMSGSFETSLTANDLKKLAKMQIKRGGSWKVYTYQLRGTASSSSECYSASGTNLYVMVPDESTVREAREYITALSDGEKIEIRKDK